MTNRQTQTDRQKERENERERERERWVRGEPVQSDKCKVETTIVVLLKEKGVQTGSEGRKIIK